MWRRISLFVAGVIIMITVTSVVPVLAQNPVSPNLDAYCQSLGYVGVKQDPTQPNNPYGKGCVDSNGIMHGMDMQAACRWQFGDVFPIAQYPDPMKPDWLCYPNNNTAPKPPPPMTPMSSTAVPQQSGGNSNPQPQNSSDAIHPDAQERPNGGVRVPIICQHWGHGWSSSEPGNAYGWTCDDGFRFGPSEFTQACQDAWGSQLPYATLANWQDKYGWRCSSQPGYVDPLPQGGNQGASSNTSCASVPSRLSVGQSAWVSDADPYDLKVFTEPSMNAPRLPGIPIRETVTIISGPECHDGRVWVLISHQGQTGWAIEVNRNNTYNLIPGTYGGGSGGAGISIPITLPDGNSFSLEVVYDANSCVIQNGAELTIMEILDLQYQLNGKSSDDKQAIVIAYLQPDAGIVEQIRHRVENAIVGLAQSCNATSARYQIGNQRMDLSGPGNIVFGYVMGAWGWDIHIENLIADSDQFVRDFGRKLSWHDEPDDICQREVGRALTAGGRVDAINAGLLSNEIGRSCTLNQ